MLSVAQAVHRADTPGSAAAHSALAHSWASERSLIKRRKTDSDCCISEEKSSSSLSPLESLKRFNFNNQEVTLTVISKNSGSSPSRSFNDLLKAPLKPASQPQQTMQRPAESSSQPSVVSKKEEDNSTTESLLANLPSFLEHSMEVQLTKVGKSDARRAPEENDESVQLSSPSEAVTIEPRKSSPSSSSASAVKTRAAAAAAKRKSLGIHSRLSQATDFLRRSNSSSTNHYRQFNLGRNSSSSGNSSGRQCDPLALDSEDLEETYDFGSKLDYFERKSPLYFKPEEVFDVESSRERRQPSSERQQHQQQQRRVSSSVSDYESFNMGVPCEAYYANKETPAYATGFPNPPGENRCWVNATLQALFSLPAIGKMAGLESEECGKLMSALMAVRNCWMRGVTDGARFDQVFQTFKDELSTLDNLYSSKAQQDVSEFVMNLLNFMKSEFDKSLKKETRHSEIENIPNNEQDNAQPKPPLPTTLPDSTKRPPLTDISASAGQSVRGANLQQQQQQQSNDSGGGGGKTKSDERGDRQPTSTSSSSSSPNPIDETFGFDVVESYTCEGCAHARQQKLEHLMLFLDLPAVEENKQQREVLLLDMIRAMFATERRNVACEECKHGSHSVASRFKRLPRILIVQVKRYEMTVQGAITKKCTALDIPKSMSLDALTLNPSQDGGGGGNSSDYEPICLISHIGDNIDSGHYISFVKHDDNWLYYDDSSVKVLTDDEVFKSTKTNAYVIFFRNTKFGQTAGAAATATATATATTVTAAAAAAAVEAIVPEDSAATQGR